MWRYPLFPFLLLASFVFGTFGEYVAEDFSDGELFAALEVDEAPAKPRDGEISLLQTKAAYVTKAARDAKQVKSKPQTANDIPGTAFEEDSGPDDGVAFFQTDASIKTGSDAASVSIDASGNAQADSLKQGRSPKREVASVAVQADGDMHVL